jgi:YVTN family beta-propeller protein
MAEVPLVGEEFAGYRLLSVLGRGGMSIVFRAENPRLGNVIALKVLDPELANNDVFRSRFLEESRIAASMNHPNVIPIHDTGSSDGLLYIAMRYVTGTDLRQMLKQRGPLPTDEAVFLISQAARALDAAHRRGLVHRDVKPANLLIERGSDESDPEHVYLTDFGITKHQDGVSGLTSAGALLGTIDYIAPEQVRGMSVLGMADQYSLGCVLYECLTGRLPYEKDFGTAIMWAHVEEPPIPPTSVRPSLPPGIDDVFYKVLAKLPGDRYDSCRSFMNDARMALGLAEPMSASGSLGMMPGSGAAPYPAELAGGGYLPSELTHDKYESRGDPTASWPVSQPVAAPPTTADPIVPPSGPGHRAGRRRSRSRRRGGGLLVAALALLLVAGAAAAVTLSLTGGHKNSGATGGSTATAGGSTASGSATASGSSTASAASVAVPTPGAKIPVGHSPNYIQVAPNGKIAYITVLGTDVIDVLDTATDKVTGTIPIPQGPPESVSFSPDSRTAYVSVYNPSSKGAQVAVVVFVDTATSKVTSFVQVNNFTPGPSVTSPDGRSLYVPNHNLSRTGVDENVVDVINLASRAVVSTIPVPANPHWVVFDKKNGHIYISDHLSTFVTVLNASDNSFIENIEVGETPHAETLSPDGSRLAVTSFDGNQVYLIDTATDKEIKVIPVGGNPLGIAYSPDGRYLFTVNNEDNSVTVIDTADNIPIANIPTGKGPSSISVLPNGRQAYVTDENDGTIQLLNIP